MAEEVRSKHENYGKELWKAYDENSVAQVAAFLLRLWTPFRTEIKIGTLKKLMRLVDPSRLDGEEHVIHVFLKQGLDIHRQYEVDQNLRDGFDFDSSEEDDS